MSKPIRTFAAVKPSAEVLDRVGWILDRFCGSTSGVKWVARHNVHVTMHFFGDLEPDTIEPLTEALRDAVRQVGTFHIAVRSVGTFPPRGRPRVVWLGLDDPQRGLVRLHEAVEDATALVGLPVEKRKFRAHLTVGRVRPRKRPAGLAQALAEAAEVDCGTCEIDSLVLFKSDLTPRGPIYEALATLPLEG